MRRAGRGAVHYARRGPTPLQRAMCQRACPPCAAPACPSEGRWARRGSRCCPSGRRQRRRKSCRHHPRRPPPACAGYGPHCSRRRRQRPWLQHWRRCLPPKHPQERVEGSSPGRRGRCRVEGPRFAEQRTAQRRCRSRGSPALLRPQAWRPQRQCLGVHHCGCRQRQARSCCPDVTPACPRRCGQQEPPQARRKLRWSRPCVRRRAAARRC
jgi:hypothetical protein